MLISVSNPVSLPVPVKRFPIQFRLRRFAFSMPGGFRKASCRKHLRESPSGFPVVLPVVPSRRWNVPGFRFAFLSYGFYGSTLFEPHTKVCLRLPALFLLFSSWRKRAKRKAAVRSGSRCFSSEEIVDAADMLFHQPAAKLVYLGHQSVEELTVV